MAILAVSESGGYSSIPVEDEDVTPVDRTITKRAQQSFQCVVISSCILLVGLVCVLVWYQRNERSDIAVYETSALFFLGMRRLVLSDIVTSAFNPSVLSFGNVQCQQDADDILCTNMPPSPSVVEFRTDEIFQKIIGFGGAFTEASAVNFYLLPSAVQTKVMDLYFGQDGLGYTLGRIHINSCDFSLASYSFDNVPGDIELKYFDREVTHDTAYVLPFIQSAMQKSARPIKLLASPWSPPAWMKAPNSLGQQTMNGSALPNGLRDEPEVKLAWARYISAFIRAYAALGVPVWSVTPQNEPEFPAPWEACAYTASFESDFIQQYLGPVLREEHPEVLILGFDHNKDHLEAWTKELMTTKTGLKYIDGMAFHWYSGGDRVEDGTYGYDAVNASHHLAPEGVLLATEGCSCPDVDLGNWLRAERLGHDVMFDLQNHAQGWIDWNLLVDHRGGPNHLKNFCDAALVVDEQYADVTVQPKFHYMGHFSKFVPPGAVRVGTSAVGNYNFEAMDPNIQAGVEVGMFACERSVRQMWRLESPSERNNGTVESKTEASEGVKHTLQLGASRIQLATRALTQDVTFAGTVQLCVAQSARLPDRTVLRLADCSDTRAVFLEVAQNPLGQLVDASSSLCLSFVGDVREPGALLELAPCAAETASATAALEASSSSFSFSSDLPSGTARAVDHQLFALDLGTGELTAPKVARSLCLTAGWPFFTAVAFTYPEEVAAHELAARQKASIVVMNEAAVATPFAVWDKVAEQYLGLSINPRAIQTVVF